MVVSPRESVPDTLAPGQHIASYRIDRLLGRGGMGAVYAATHTGIARQVAIKVLHAEHATEPEFVRRFLDEARAVNLISHPNIVDIYDVGQTPDRAPYLVMEYLAGESLAERLGREENLQEANKRIEEAQAYINAGPQRAFRARSTSRFFWKVKKREAPTICATC
jgi:serine/threonine protein kinase